MLVLSRQAATAPVRMRMLVLSRQAATAPVRNRMRRVEGGRTSRDTLPLTI